MYQCSKCERSFSSKFGARIHELRTHAPKGQKWFKNDNSTKDKNKKLRTLTMPKGRRQKQEKIIEIITNILSNHPSGLPTRDLYQHMKAAGFKSKAKPKSYDAIIRSSIKRIKESPFCINDGIVTVRQIDKKLSKNPVKHDVHLANSELSVAEPDIQSPSALDERFKRCLELNTFLMEAVMAQQQQSSRILQRMCQIVQV